MRLDKGLVNSVRLLRRTFVAVPVVKREKRSVDTEPKPALIGYARVSTEDQNLDLQVRALREAGCDPIYQEKLSARAKVRPMLDNAILDLRPGETLVVWRLDRLARSVREMHRRLDDVAACGGKFKSLSEQFDFDSMTGRFVLVILGAVAELEAQLIGHRTSAGIAALKARGGYWGREVKMTAEVLDRMEPLLKAGWTAQRVADKFKVKLSSIYTYFSFARGRIRRKRKPSK